MVDLSKSFLSSLQSHNAVLQPRYCRNNTGLGSSPFARHYLGNHVCFLLLRVLRCFSSPRLPPTLSRILYLQYSGLPHSDIDGSKVVCTYPSLFAAYHVLLRLREPRYPPSALISFFLTLVQSFDYTEIRLSRTVLFLSKMSKIFFFVENKGLEPLTPCVQGRCSKPTELIPPLMHIVALLRPNFFSFLFVVPGRVELPTSTLSVWRSNQLSYRTGSVFRLIRLYLFNSNSQEK